MRIRMVVDLQGFTVRSDGSLFEWPRRGHEVEVDGSLGRDMVSQGYAIPVVEQRAEDTRRPVNDEEQRTMGAARLFARPQAAEEPITMDAQPEPEIAPAPEPIVESSPEPESSEAPVKRGPGRPRKNPY